MNIYFSSNPVQKFLLIFLAIIGPAFLFFVERGFSYPEILEEIYKAIAIWLLMWENNQSSFSKNIVWVVLFGIIFGLMEGFLYFSNFIYIDYSSMFLARMIFPVAMHIITSLIILWSIARKRYLFFIGLGLSIAVHYLYNLLILSEFHVVIDVGTMLVLNSSPKL